jgi:hypothetical protein
MELLSFSDSCQIEGNEMDENTPAQPVIDKYKGKPVLRIALVNKPNPPDTNSYWMSFGTKEDRTIVKIFCALGKSA